MRRSQPGEPFDAGRDVPRITVLSGGLGGARLALAIAEADRQAHTTFVTNVADDWTVGELPVCPDTDSVLYALAGLFDEERGWGRLGDVFPGPRRGEPSWFGIGELDRVTHERRRDLLTRGASLAEATAALAQELGVAASVLPVTNDPVRTRLRTGGSWLAFQEWMVRRRCPAVEAIRWDGLDGASPSPGVIDAIADADLVVIASSSPMASITPILGVAGIRDALARRRRPTVALSPVVVGREPTTDRDRHRAAARGRLLAAAGIEPTPSAIAAWLAPLASHVAVDPCDAGELAAIARTGAVGVVAPVIGADADERRSLIDCFDTWSAMAVGIGG